MDVSEESVRQFVEAMSDKSREDFAALNVIYRSGFEVYLSQGYPDASTDCDDGVRMLLDFFLLVLRGSSCHAARSLVIERPGDVRQILAESKDRRTKVFLRRFRLNLPQ